MGVYSKGTLRRMFHFLFNPPPRPFPLFIPPPSGKPSTCHKSRRCYITEHATLRSTLHSAFCSFCLSPHKTQKPSIRGLHMSAGFASRIPKPSPKPTPPRPRSAAQPASPSPWSAPKPPPASKSTPPSKLRSTAAALRSDLANVSDQLTAAQQKLSGLEQQRLEAETPPHLRCPITLQRMISPVRSFS